MFSKITYIIIFLFFFSPLYSSHAAQDTFTNISPTAPRGGFAPGSIIILPDGRQAVIESALPDGQYKTDLGIIVSPEGVIMDGEAKGQTVILVEPEKTQAAAPEVEELENPEKSQVSTPKAQEPVKPETSLAQPEQEIVIERPENKAQTVIPEKPAEPAQKEAPKSATVETPEKGHYYTLAELLPMTETPGKTETPNKPEEKAAQPKAAEKEKPEVKKEPKAEKPKEQPKHKAPEAEKPKPEPKKEVKKTEPKHQPARPGQALRIPPEAAKSGNLDFLEGCWQGIRPEYYSKRAIRECFCFGKNGKNGKRRVFDPQGGRQCIGSTRASLSSSGVLSVTSSGAACNDGQRWGQAEMVCRNSGPKTPCSWVFRDANNGRQSYEIPFTRVESCGR